MDKLVFFAKSADVITGCAKNEFVSNARNYEKLNGVSHWRRLLDDQYEGAFVYQKLSYLSVIHALCAAKYLYFDKELLAYEYTLDSNSQISQKKLHHNGKCILTIAQKKIWQEQKSRHYIDILTAKFSTNPFKEILISTNNAELFHYSASHKTDDHLERCFILEHVRNTIFCNN